MLTVQFSDMAAALARGDIDAFSGAVSGPGPDRGVVFQDYGLFPWMTVAANIGYGPRQRGIPRARVAEITRHYLELVQLERFADRYPAQLSGGMQQRVAIARVLANDPAVLLMDEPFGALDSLTREKLQRRLHAIWREVRSTVVFITHNVEEAVFLADRVIVMSGGPNHGTPARAPTTKPDRPEAAVPSRGVGPGGWRAPFGHGGEPHGSRSRA